MDEQPWQSMFPLSRGADVRSLTVTCQLPNARTLAILFGEPVWRMRLRIARARLMRWLRRR